MAGTGHVFGESAEWVGELSMYVGVVGMLCVEESEIPLFLSGNSINNA